MGSMGPMGRNTHSLCMRRLAYISTMVVRTMVAVAVVMVMGGMVLRTMPTIIILIMMLTQVASLLMESGQPLPEGPTLAPFW
jgi:hypothetical protein